MGAGSYIFTDPYDYDDLYRLESVTDGGGQAVGYTYYPAGNRHTMTYPSGQVITYTYDMANRLDTVTDWDGGVYDYTFDDAHRLKQIVLPNTLAGTGAITSTYDYDDAGRLVALTHASATQVLAGYYYDLDKVGNRRVVTETLIVPVDPPEDPSPLDSMAATFTYNGDGDRVAQTINGVSVDLALDVVGLPEVIATSNGDKYLHLPSLIVQQQAGRGTKYLLVDALGSIRQAVDSTGQVVVVNEYDPYGVPLQGGGSPYGYTGEWWQGEVNLLYLRARWYHPGTGRFLNRDPFPGFAQRPTTLHSYAYAINNPTNATDPSGYQVAEGLILTACAIEAPVCLAGAVIVVAVVGGVALIYVTTDYLMQHPELWRSVYPPGQPGPEPAPEAQDYYQPPSGTQTETQTQPLDEWVEVANNAWNNWQPEPEREPEPNPRPVPLGPDIVVIPPTCTKTPEPKWYLYHYTDDTGLAGILATQQIWPSIRNPADPRTDAQWGDGQYFTDISPQDASRGSAYQLSRALFTMPWLQEKVKNWVKINVAGLPVKRVAPVFSRTYGDKSIYLHPSQSPLDVVNRIDGWGITPFAR